MYSTKYPYGDLKDEKMLGKASQFISDSNSPSACVAIVHAFLGEERQHNYSHNMP